MPAAIAIHTRMTYITLSHIYTHAYTLTLCICALICLKVYKLHSQYFFF